jgi:hypothetical protein
MARGRQWPSGALRVIVSNEHVRHAGNQLAKLFQHGHVRFPPL